MILNLTTRIRQVLFTLEKNLSYKFDVNQTVTIKGLKKMIIAAANLGRSELRVFNRGIEYTDNDDSTLEELFPELQLVEFVISIDLLSEEDIESHLKVRLGNYCLKHQFKYPYFFCYDCEKSMCNLCLQSGEHKNHHYLEKYDYLQSSRNLVETIFFDLKEILSGSKLDLKDVELLRDKIKIEFFPNLIELVKYIQAKMMDLIDFFVESEKTSFNNVRQNVGLLKNHCSDGLDKLKSEIAIQDMMLDEEIFLTFDRKFKEISTEKVRVFKDVAKFEELRRTLQFVVGAIENNYKDIYSFLERHANLNLYDDIKSKISENIVSMVSKEDIFNKLLSDIKKKGGKNFTNLKFGETPKSGIMRPFFEQLTNEKEIPNIQAFTPLKEPQDIRLNNLEASLLVQGKSLLILSLEEPKKIIIQRIANSKNLVYYNEENELISLKTIDFPSLLGVPYFLDKSSYLNLNGKLYVSGGILREGPTKVFIEYDPITNSLSRLADMLTARHSHSMICHQDNIYVVGGNTNACEKYDLKNKTWTIMPSLLSEERQSPILIVNGNFLYAFFGLTNGEYTDTIERINLKNPRSKWEILPYQKSKEMSLKFIGGAIIEENDREILILGGKSEQGLRKVAIKFNFSNCNFTHTEISLEDGTYFHESSLTKLDKFSYGHFEADKNENFLKLQLAS